MKKVYLALSMFLLGFLASILSEPKAIQLNTCYVNNKGEIAYFTVFLAHSKKEEPKMLFGKSHSFLYSWQEYIQHKLVGITTCD